MEPALKAEVGDGLDFETQFLSYSRFEKYSFKAEDQSYSEFLTEWYKRQKAALDTGLNYPDLMLAFKLLRDSCLGLEVNMAVLAKLQSCQTGFIEDYVTQTSTCLIDICVKQAGQVKTELEYDEDESYMNLDITDHLSLDINDHSDESFDNDDKDDVKPENIKPPTKKSISKLKGGVESQTEVERPLLSCKVDQCRFTTRYISNLKRHHIKHHNGVTPENFELPKRKVKKPKVEKTEEDPDKIHYCPVDQCPYFTKKEGRLRCHLKLSSHEKLGMVNNLFRCMPCKKRFNTQERLDAHIKTHREIPCDQCDKVFTKIGLLNKHKRDFHHINGKTFTCELCGKLFYTSSNLANHKNSHGERKYVCPWDGCGKSFLLNNILQRHIVVHTGDKNFECDQCGKCFGRQSGLARHMDRHNGVKRAECEVCQKKFFDNGKLKVHMRIHTGERPYNCDVCERSFVQSKDLKQHMEKLHHPSSTTIIVKQQHGL